MKKQKMVIGLVIVIIIIVAALLGIKILKSNDKTYVKLNEKFTLNGNEIVYFNADNQDFIIKLENIVDNSCPKDTQCIWEGSYVVNITINNINYEMGTISPSDRLYTLNIKGTSYNINLDGERNRNKATFFITKEAEELTDDEILEMEEVNNYISNIQNSEAYKILSVSEKLSFMKDELNKLATIGTEDFKKPLIKKSSIHSEDNQYSTLITFEYSCGVLGGVMLTESNLTYMIDNNVDYYNSKNSERGVYYDTFNQPDAPSFYTIAMGDCYSPGASISIEKVNIDSNDNVEVIVKETVPKHDDGMSSPDVCTYPKAELTLNKLPNSIVVKNVEGQVFKHINF